MKTWCLALPGTQGFKWPLRSSPGPNAWPNQDQSVRTSQHCRWAIYENLLRLRSLVTFACLNLFQLLWIILYKSKSPCPSAEAGLSNESFPKVEKLLGRAVTVAETSSVVTNAAATSANDCTWALWEVQRFGPTDFCKSKDCQHKSAIYFSALLKSLYSAWQQLPRYVDVSSQRSLSFVESQRIVAAPNTWTAACWTTFTVGECCSCFYHILLQYDITFKYI